VLELVWFAVLVGHAGAGKTRPALELCECLKEPWDAGRARPLLAARTSRAWD
jgi:hypothetical protein